MKFGGPRLDTYLYSPFHPRCTSGGMARPPAHFPACALKMGAYPHLVRGLS